MTERWLGTAYAHPDDVPAERWAQSMQTRTEYEAMVRERAERDRHAPKVGAPAPDFAIERLAPDGTRAGEMFRLSEMRGRPVAIVFGSYT
jgi:hypothetical protein